MAALHPPATPATPTEVHVEAADEGPDHGQIFLILRRDPRQAQRAATVRAGGGQRRGIGLVDVRGNRASRPTAVSRASAPTRTPPAALRAIFRERSRLTKARASRRVELLLEAFAPLFPPIAVAYRTGQFLPQSRDLLLLAFDQNVAVIAGRARAFICHTTVMAGLNTKYKYGILDFARSGAGTR
jgi:hypothetical protein